MTAIINSRKVALVDDTGKKISYLDKGAKVVVSNDTAFLGLWADKQYTKIDTNGTVGYVLTEALDKEGN